MVALEKKAKEAEEEAESNFGRMKELEAELEKLKYQKQVIPIST
jgi:hypothetical protein